LFTNAFDYSHGILRFVKSRKELNHAFANNFERLAETVEIINEGKSDDVVSKIKNWFTVLVKNIGENISE